MIKVLRREQGSLEMGAMHEGGVLLSERDMRLSNWDRWLSERDCWLIKREVQKRAEPVACQDAMTAIRDRILQALQ